MRNGPQLVALVGGVVEPLGDGGLQKEDHWGQDLRGCSLVPLPVCFLLGIYDGCVPLKPNKPFFPLEKTECPLKYL